jgi:hypothetical protein
MRKFIQAMVVLTASILMGCGEGGDKEKTDKIDSFTAHLGAARTAYGSECLLVKSAFQGAADAPEGTLPGVVRSALQMMPQDYAKKAANELANAERDFEYIYTHYHLSGSAKDDFYEVKDIFARHFIFVQNLREGRLSQDSLKQWVADNNKLDSLCDKITLEMKRL